MKGLTALIGLLVFTLLLLVPVVQFNLAQAEISEFESSILASLADVDSALDRFEATLASELDESARQIDKLESRLDKILERVSGP